MARTSIHHKKTKKPSKPYPSFPLTAHNNGQWCKKIRGKVHFFGIWADPQAALDNYLRVAQDLHAGRHPESSTITPDGPTVKAVCNHYLTYQLGRVESGEIGYRWFEDCRCVLEDFARSVSSGQTVSNLTQEDFLRYRHRLQRRGLTGRKGLGVHALNRAITVVRAAFRYAYDTEMSDRPMRYGKAFEKPSATQKRRTRRIAEVANGKKLFEPAAIRTMLAVADTQLKAMILLGVNGGFGNTDCARLPIKAVDLENAVVEFDRPKTGVERVVPLWPETIAAIEEVLKKRQKPIDTQYGDLLFVRFGRPWYREHVHRLRDGGITSVAVTDVVGECFEKLLLDHGMKRKGIGFYTLRHTFRTWADEVKDQHAIHRIMGHVIPGMSGIYVEKIELDRLRAVVDHVHEKLFSDQAETCPDQPSPPQGTAST